MPQKLLLENSRLSSPDFIRYWSLILLTWVTCGLGDYCWRLCTTAAVYALALMAVETADGVFVWTPMRVGVIFSAQLMCSSRRSGGRTSNTKICPLVDILLSMSKNTWYATKNRFSGKLPILIKSKQFSFTVRRKKGDKITHFQSAGFMEFQLI